MLVWLCAGVPVVYGVFRETKDVNANLDAATRFTRMHSVLHVRTVEGGWGIWKKVERCRLNRDIEETRAKIG